MHICQSDNNGIYANEKSEFMEAGHMNLLEHLLIFLIVIVAGVFVGWFVMNYFVNSIVGGRFFKKKER